MIDKSLGIFLILLFGISGIAVLMLAWLRPMPESERILTTFVGSVGLLVASIQSIRFKHLPVKANAQPFTVKIEVENKS